MKVPQQSPRFCVDCKYNGKLDRCVRKLENKKLDCKEFEFGAWEGEKCHSVKSVPKKDD